MSTALTILLVVVVIAVLWILFKLFIGMAASLFRIGCFIIFVLAAGAAIWYFFF